MIIDTQEAICTNQVLSMLSKKQSKYNEMFRTTKVSHTTLQKVLRELSDKEFVVKHDIGHMNVNYEITDKGKKLLKSLNNLKQLLD